MKEMLSNNLIDIQSHTYNTHNYIVKNPEGKTGGELAYKKYDMKTKTYESEESYQNRVKEDLIASQQFFKDKLNYETDTLCFPFGHYNKKLIEIADSVGFKSYVTTIYGYNKQDSHKNLIWRIRAGDAKLDSQKLKQNIIDCANNVKKN